MTGPDLPQPIYPTPGTGGGGPSGPPAPAAAPAGWPPAAPPGPPGGSSFGGPGQPYGGPPGPPPGGPPKGPGSGPSTKLIFAATIGLIALVSIIIVVVKNGGDDESSGKKTGPTTVSTTIGPGADTGSGNGTGTGTGDTSGGGTDVQARAQAVAANQIIGASPETVECLTTSLVNDTALLDAIEPQAAGVSFESADDAAYYASFIMLCASPDEVKQLFLDAYSAQGFDQLQLGCIDAEMSTWTVDTFEAFIASVAHPASAPQVESTLTDILSYC